MDYILELLQLLAAKVGIRYELLTISMVPTGVSRRLLHFFGFPSSSHRDSFLQFGLPNVHLLVLRPHVVDFATLLVQFDSL